MEVVPRIVVEINSKPAPALETVPPEPASAAIQLHDRAKALARGGTLTVLEPVGDGLGVVVTELIEDGVAAHEATGLATIVAGGAATMATLADCVPSWAECASILPGPGKKSLAAARILARQLMARGIEVRLIERGV
jgi:hypothetical protein